MSAVDELVDLIKNIVVGVLESKKTVAVITGTVESVNPIKINIDKRLPPLAEGFLVIPKHLKEEFKAKTIETYPVSVNINNTIQKGDTVTLLRKQGGQQFVVLGRV